MIKTPSVGYSRLLSELTTAKSIRVQTLAKEASAIARLLRTVPGQFPRRSELEERYFVLERLLEGEDKSILPTDDPTELIELTRAATLFDYCELFSSEFSTPETVKRFKLRDVVTLHSSESDTRHQDTKDIERDAVYIGKDSHLILHGSSVGYDGIVKAICAEVAEQCAVHSDHEAIRKFSRSLLNAANRTTSGGDAFETIERFVRPVHLVFVAPDSTAPLEPIRIYCDTGLFRTRDGWEWGVRGYTEATSKYVIYENDDVDRINPLAKIEGTCRRIFGLPLPLPQYNDSRLLDDGKSMVARGLFECDDGGYVEIKGTLLR